MNRTFSACLTCALGVCAIAAHNGHFFQERPGEPCIYSAPCAPRQPLADLPEGGSPANEASIVAAAVYVATISTVSTIYR